MKKFFKIIIIVFLLLVYTYVYNIDAIPKNVILLEGEKIKLNTAVGLSLQNNYEITPASSSLSKQTVNSSNTVNLNLFGKVNVKKLRVEVIPKTKVVPLGVAIGMKLYTKGVLVVGMSEIQSANNKKEKPYEKSGIEEGDSIIAVNNTEVSNTDDLIRQVNNSKGNEVNIKYLKQNQLKEANIKPAKIDNSYKLGLWVRDATAGVGTLTFYEPSTNLFMCLGHGITDIDTKEIVNISNGELVTANIMSIIKGEKNQPGEIRGTIINGNTIGNIYKNTEFGVYGNLKNKQYLSIQNEEMEIANREEIKEGKAMIISQLDNTAPKQYEIEIEKIYINNNENNKSMLIKITDQELLNKTGGIIQGMSGSPIIQNGKFIGAVTNVLIKDPEKGYGIFGDLLIKQMRDI